MIPLVQVDHHFYRVPIPVPFPMKYIYCYLFKGKDGWGMVDTGFNYPEAQDAWKKTFSQLGINPKDICGIYLTHFHPDHFGLAGWMQELTGAPVSISEADLAMVDRIWKQGSIQANRVGEMCQNNGVPSDLAQQIVEHMEKLNKHVYPLPELHALPEKEVFLGDEVWQIIRTPGHSDGHVCFFHEQKKLLLAGDHILDKITPNVSLWPGCSPNPLKHYIDSLKRVASMDISLALPSHGDLIRTVRQRINEILRHHELRLEKMYTLAKQGRTAYEVAASIFKKELSPHQWRFAMAETLAHLEYLISQGKLKKSEGTTTVYFIDTGSVA